MPEKGSQSTTIKKGEGSKSKKASTLKGESSRSKATAPKQKKEKKKTEKKDEGIPHLVDEPEEEQTAQKTALVVKKKIELMRKRPKRVHKAADRVKEAEPVVEPPRKKFKLKHTSKNWVGKGWIEATQESDSDDSWERLFEGSNRVEAIEEATTKATFDNEAKNSQMDLGETQTEQPSHPSPIQQTLQTLAPSPPISPPSPFDCPNIQPASSQVKAQPFNSAATEVLETGVKAGENMFLAPTEEEINQNIRAKVKEGEDFVIGEE